MTDHDGLFKELLTTFFADFLVLFLEDLAAEIVPDSVELLDKELLGDPPSQGERRVVDVLARLRTRAPLVGAEGAHLVYVHVENQARPAPGFQRRLFQYFVRLVARHGEAIYPVAVFSYDRPRRPEPESYEISLPGLDVLRFRFRVVQLGRLPWREFLGRPNPVAAALMAKMRIAPGDRPRVKAACLRMLAGLALDPARTRLVSGFVDTYLKLDEAGETLLRRELDDAPPEERRRAMEIVTSWQVRGRAQGVLEVVTSQLGRRVGPLPAATAERVAALDVDALKALAEALLDFHDPADLDRWLAAH